MSKRTITAYVHYEEPPSWCVEKLEPFKVYPFDMSSAGHVLVSKQEIEVEVPDDFNPVPAQIAVLEKQKADLRAKLARELMTIDQRISKLQALPMAEVL